MHDPAVLTILDTLCTDDMPDTVLADVLAEHLRTTIGLSADSSLDFSLQ